MTIRTLRTLALALLIALVGTALAQDDMNMTPGEGVSVQPGVATWQSALPLEAIFGSLLGELGYEVETAQSLSNPIFYQSVAQGDVDFWANGWFPLHDAQLPANFEQNASIVGTVVENGALQGYLVSREAAEEYDITSLEDFKRDEVKEAFDANGDGLADLVACPPGWGCEGVINHHLEVYELEDHVNPITAAYAASFADALARYRAGEPVLYYTWTPNFTVFQLAPGEDVVWINVPEINPTEGQMGLEDAMVAEDIPGAVTDPITFGFVANSIQTVANNEFLEANPAAATLFELVEVSLDDVSAMTARIADGESSDAAVQAIADEWIETNRATVDEWLAQAREAAAQ